MFILVENFYLLANHLVYLKDKIGNTFTLF
jgi:hypothetical protein